MIDLRLGDALCPTDGLNSLADGSIDHILSDPPFDERTHRAALEHDGSRPGDRRVAGALPFAALDPETIALLARQFARLTRRWIAIACGERQVEAWAASLEAAGARFVRLGVALRTNPRPQMYGDRPAPAVDPIVIAHAGQGRTRWNGGGRAARWPSPPARYDEGGQVHPTQKSLALMRALVGDFTDAGDLVCDPFAGAGTTAVACKVTGRRFVGWELESQWHAAALRRLEGVREQLRLSSRAC